MSGQTKESSRLRKRVQASILWAVLSVVLLGPFLTSCRLFYPPRVETRDVEIAKGVVRSSTVAVTGEGLQELSAVSDDYAEIRLREGATGPLSSIAVGETVVLGISPETPYGLLRSVTEVAADDGEQRVLTTSPARLEDAFEDLSIDVSATFSPEDPRMRFRALRPGVSLLRTRGLGDYLAVEDDQLTISLDDVVIYDDDGDRDTESDQVKLTGSLVLRVHTDFSFQLLRRYLRFSLTPEVEDTLKVSAEIEKDSLDISLPIGRIEQRFAFLVGGIPVIVTPGLELVVGVEGKTSVQFETSISASASFTAGLEYRDGLWQEIRDSEIEFDYQLPVVTGEFEARGYLRPGFSVRLYESVSPHVSWEPFLRLSADASLDSGGVISGDGFFSSSWALAVGHRINVGCTVGVFGFLEEDFTFEIPISERVLASSLAAPTEVDADSSGESDAGVIVTWSGGRGAEEFRVFRSSTIDSGYSEVARVSASRMSYLDDQTVPGSDYYYRIKAFHPELGESPPSEAASISLPERPPGRIEVTAPSHLDSLVPGTGYTVRWTTANVSSALVDLSLHSGSDLVSVIVTGTEGDGSYEWLVPQVPAASDYRVRTVVVGQEAIFDFSDEFTIEQERPFGTITGHVRDAASEEYLGDVWVHAYQGSVTEQNIVAEATTNGQGEYRMELPSETDYTLVFERSGYLDVVFRNVEVYSVEATVLETIMQVDETYQGTGGASGTVIDAGRGESITGVLIEVREGVNNTTGSVVRRVETDMDGVYTISELSAGNYTVLLSASGYADASYSMLILGGLTLENQNYSLARIGGAGETRIVLSWGASPADLDSHLTGPEPTGDRFHVYYSSPGSSSSTPYVKLDRDDTNSYGPETITIYSQEPGTYRYSVHDYSNRISSTSNALSNSNAVVKVYRDGTLLRAFSVPANTPGTLWTVFEIEDATIAPINDMSFEADTSLVGAALPATDAALFYSLPAKQ